MALRSIIDDLTVRAMTELDVDAVSDASAAAFGISISGEQEREGWRNRISYPLADDPAGAFVAEREGRVVGVAQAMVRERLWCLSLLTVTPDAQSSGAGRVLFDRALAYRSDLRAGLIVSSNDPRAMRLYSLAGFAVQPTLQAEGAVDRRRLEPPGLPVREGGEEDLEALAPISREIRGAPHSSEIRFALRRESVLLRCGDRGFAVASPQWGLWLLVARDEAAAAALLWAALDRAGEAERPVRWVTGEQQWAVDVIVRAGLRLSANGALCVRGEPGPLRPFIPSGPFA